jgi:hypothetical protein
VVIVFKVDVILACNEMKQMSLDEFEGIRALGFGPDRYLYMEIYENGIIKKRIILPFIYLCILLSDFLCLIVEQN